MAQNGRAAYKMGGRPKQDGPKRGRPKKHRVGELVVTQIWRCGWDLPRDSLALEKRKTTKQLISIQYIIYNQFLNSNHTTYRL